MANTIYKDVLSPESDLKLWDGSTGEFNRTNSSGGTDTLNVFQWIGVDVLNKYGARTDSAIHSALLAIGTSNKAVVWLAPGTWTISATRDWSAYANVVFVIPPGALLSYGAYGITFPGEIWAGSYKIFSGTGSIEIASIQDINVAWWGVSTAESAANNYDFMQYAVNALTSSGGTVRWDLLPLGTYQIDDAIEVTTSNTRLISRKGVVLKQTTTNYIIYAHGTDASNKDENVEILSFDLDMNNQQEIAVYGQYLQDSVARDIDVANATGANPDSVQFVSSTNCVEGYTSQIDENLKTRFLL